MMGGVIKHGGIVPGAKDLLPIGYFENLIGIACLAKGHGEVNIAFS